MGSKKNEGWGSLGCLGWFILVMMVIGLGTVAVLEIRNSKAAAPFSAMKQQVQAVCSQCGLGTSRFQGAGYRQGKVLVVDSQTGKAVGHTMAEEKLKGIVAASPEEVGTIICLGPEVKSRYGTYDSGEPAYQKSRGFCVYDLAGGKVIQSGKLIGSAPPRIKTTGGSASGSDPAYSELTEFISKMVEK